MIAALAPIDKLRWWFAVPIGIAAGAAIGYSLSDARWSPTTVVLAVGTIAGVLMLALSTPSPEPPARHRSNHSSAARSGPTPGISTDDIL